MISNDDDYRNAMSVNNEERRRIDGLVEVWRKQGLGEEEIKRLSDPMMSLHLQFVEEAEAWRREKWGPEMGVEECADGFVVVEPKPGNRILYSGRDATATRMDMLSKDDLFPTRDEAEARMLAMFPVEGGCMGPPPPSRAEIVDTTTAVRATLRDRGLLPQDEESLCQLVAESRRRALWLLEKAVEEILCQDACENF